MSTPLIGGRGALSLCVWREWGKGRIPQPTPKTKKAVWHRWGGRCGAPPCRGIPFQYAKIIKKRGTMHKIGRKMMFLRMSGMICQNFCLNLHRFIRAV